MRLLVVSQHFWPENFRINDLVLELSRRGHDVTVLTGYPNYPDGDVYPEFREKPSRFGDYHGVKVVRVPVVPRGKGSIRLMLNFVSFALTGSVIGPLRLRGQLFDAIFVFGPTPVTVGLPGAALRCVKRAPMVFWVLDLWPEILRAIGVVRSEWLLALVGKLVSFIYRRCDLVLAQSRSFIPQIVQYRRHGPTLYFPNWSESVFSLSNVELATEVLPSADTFDVMFAGNIGESQDFPTLLRAAELLHEHKVRWLVVGDGRMASWVQEQVRQRGLQDRFLMLGRHPLERMPSFYRHANALLVSLKDEPVFSMTIPGKLQSYFAAGMPVIAALNGEGAEIVERARAGVSCRAGDAQGLADAILKLAASSAEELHAMGANAARFAAMEFDRDVLIDRLETWLVALKDRRPLGAPADEELDASGQG